MHEFIDAHKMAEKRPDTFSVPGPEDWLAVKAGWFVKVCLNDERFWVKISEIEGNKITGVVDNDLVNEQPFACGDTVECECRHVYQISCPPGG